MREFVRELNRHRHEFGRFIRRVTKHHALVACTTCINTLRNINRLCINRAHDSARLEVKPVFGVGIPDAFNCGAHHIRQVHVSRCRDFTGDHNKAGRDQRFTGDTRGRILGKDGVQHGVGDLVGDLVGMALGN